MDSKVFAWGRQVKARTRGPRRALPPVWLFTDAKRLPDPLPVIAALPRRLCGVVLRHDTDPDRPGLAVAVARLCRARGLALSVAGDWRLASRLQTIFRGTGLHLRAGRRPLGAPQCLPCLTASAHDAADIVRASRAGVRVVFISPAFATVSHPGAAPLGPARWAALARRAGGAGLVPGALGGISSVNIRRLPPCRAVGAIDALRSASP